MGPKVLMVTEESATRTGLSDRFDRKIPLNRDHSGLVKFENRYDGDYEMVMQKIKTWAAEAPQRGVEYYTTSMLRKSLCGCSALNDFTRTINSARKMSSKFDLASHKRRSQQNC
jgi:hypothetical protein